MIKRKDIFTKFTLLSLLVAMAFSMTAQPDGIKLSQPWVFSNSFEKGLFKAEMRIYDNSLSGLIIIKRTGETFRAVFVSEIGIKYFDIEIGSNETNDFTVHYILEMLNRKQITAFIEDTFRMLTMSFGETKKESSFLCDGSGNMVKVTKTQNHGKFRYDYHPNFGQVNTMIQFGFLKKTLINIELSEYDYLSPSLIVAKQKKMQLVLKQIEQ